MVEIFKNISILSLLITIILLFSCIGGILWMVFTDANIGKLVAISGILSLLFTLIFGVFGVLGIYEDFKKPLGVK